MRTPASFRYRLRGRLRTLLCLLALATFLHGLALPALAAPAMDGDCPSQTAAEQCLPEDGDILPQARAGKPSSEKGSSCSTPLILLSEHALAAPRPAQAVLFAAFGVDPPPAPPHLTERPPTGLA